MTDPASNAGYRQAPIGPGRLILVVGPSGAGKDTLLALTRAACATETGIVFPQRMVTRATSPGEDNLAIGRDVFRQLLTRDGFALQWDAHGHLYGVPRAIDHDIRDGRTVVVNASRTVIAATRAAYAAVTVVMITAPYDVRARRLADRARPGDGRIEERLARSVADAHADFTIDNIGEERHHALELARIVRGF